jgi:hypothetical protein
VRSGDGFCGDASLELEGEELTDFGVVRVAAALKRAASWSPVTHTGVPSRVAVRQSWPLSVVLALLGHRTANVAASSRARKKSGFLLKL